jgi:hypothetical protein
MEGLCSPKGTVKGLSIYLDTFILKINNSGEACALRDGIFLAELMGCNKLIAHSDCEITVMRNGGTVHSTQLQLSLSGVHRCDFQALS